MTTLGFSGRVRRTRYQISAGAYAPVAPALTAALLYTKIESILFVPENLTFSENLRCLNLPLLVGALSQKRSLSLTCFVFAGQNVHSGKFKHLKYSEMTSFQGQIVLIQF